MLVALVLLAVISGLMTAFIGQFRTINRIRMDTSARMELEAVTAYLESAIGGALPRPFIEIQAERRFSFEGTATSLRFVTIARKGVAAFALRETGIVLAGDGPRKTLVQDFAPRRLDATVKNAATTSIDLAGDVAALTFEYLSYDPTTKAPLWTESWVSRPGLPAAVRISITAERNGKLVTAEGQAVLALSAGSQPVGQQNEL
jgi:hypothetical protein